MTGPVNPPVDEGSAAWIAVVALVMCILTGRGCLDCDGTGTKLRDLERRIETLEAKR